MDHQQHKPARPYPRKDLLRFELELVCLREPERLRPNPSCHCQPRLESTHFQAGPNEGKQPEEPEEILAGADLVERDEGDGLRRHGRYHIALSEVVAECRYDEQLR